MVRTWRDRCLHPIRPHVTSLCSTSSSPWCSPFCCWCMAHRFAHWVNWRPFDPTMAKMLGAALFGFSIGSLLAARDPLKHRVIVQMEIVYALGRQRRGALPDSALRQPRHPRSPRCRSPSPPRTTSSRPHVPARRRRGCRCSRGSRWGPLSESAARLPPPRLLRRGRLPLRHLQRRQSAEARAAEGSPLRQGRARQELGRRPRRRQSGEA